MKYSTFIRIFIICDATEVFHLLLHTFTMCTMSTSMWPTPPWLIVLQAINTQDTLGYFDSKVLSHEKTSPRHWQFCSDSIFHHKIVSFSQPSDYLKYPCKRQVCREETVRLWKYTYGVLWKFWIKFSYITQDTQRMDIWWRRKLAHFPVVADLRL